MREWLRDNSAPDRLEVAKPIIKQLEAKGPAPTPTTSAFVQPEAPTRKRPILKFKKARKFKTPKLDSLALQTKELAGRFADAGLNDEFEQIAQRCVWMIPTRVDESKLALGGTNRHLTKLLKGTRLDSYEQEVYGEPPLLPQLLGYRVHGYDAEEPATAQMLLQLPGDDQTEMEFGDVDVATSARSGRTSETDDGRG